MINAFTSHCRDMEQMHNSVNKWIDMIAHCRGRNRGDNELKPIADELVNAIVGDTMLCPISQATITDPVIDTTTGVSFEMKKLYSWLELRQTSPISRNPLTTAELVQNITLKRLVRRLAGVSRVISEKIAKMSSEGKLSVATNITEEDVKEHKEFDRKSQFTFLNRFMTHGGCCNSVNRAELICQINSCLGTGLFRTYKDVGGLFDKIFGCSKFYTAEDMLVHSKDLARSGRAEEGKHSSVRLKRIRLVRTPKKKTTIDHYEGAFAAWRVVIYLMCDSARIDMSINQFSRLCGLKTEHVYGYESHVDFMSNPACCTQPMLYRSNIVDDCVVSNNSHNSVVGCGCSSKNDTSFSARRVAQSVVELNEALDRTPGTSGYIQTVASCVPASFVNGNGMHEHTAALPGVMTAKIIPVGCPANRFWFRPYKSSVGIALNVHDLMLEADKQCKEKSVFHFNV